MTGPALTKAEIAPLIDLPADEWHGNCHSVSLAIVKAGLVDGGRVARGVCKGVGSQHSWIAVGDCYDRKATIIDPTLWTYRDDVDDVWVGSLSDNLHTPHGTGYIWAVGRPPNATGPVVSIPTADLSSDAIKFLDMLGPLDWQGWHMLASLLPVEGWPAGEIYAAMNATPELQSVVPVDRLGMLTDLNPGGLYR